MIIVRIFLFFLCCNNLLFGACHSKTDLYDVIIVGAGISGLSAASTLKKNHVGNILILEAADRIGGRVWTEDPWGTKLEMGASWIHGIENSPTHEIIKDMHLPIQPTIYNGACPTCKMKSMALYDQDGKRLSPEEVSQLAHLASDFEDYLTEINDHGKANNLTFLDALNDFSSKNKLSKQMFDRLYFIIRLLITYEFSLDLQNISATVLKLYGHSKVSGTHGIIPMGYNLLAGKLAKNIPIEMNCAVESISYDKDIVECKTAKGVFRGKNCIVTVPLGVLKQNKIAFSPPLPKDTQGAIDTIDMGVFNKIYLFFPCIFWDKDVEWIELMPSPALRDQNYDILNYAKFCKQPILLVFTAGSFGKEVEKWSDKQTVDAIMSVLKKLYGENIPSPSSYRITRWGQDPLFLGSYSSPGLHADTQTYTNFANPVRNLLFFAGEATSETDCSTVLGAFLTGERAAKQVLTKMNIEPILEN